MSFDGTDFQRLHLDETHGEDRPYDAGFLRQTRSNVVFLNRERGHDCSITWAGSTAGSNVRAEQIRPWCHLTTASNGFRPEYMSIWRTWVLAGQGVKTIEMDIWYRVSDLVSDPPKSDGTGEGTSGTNQQGGFVEARLSTPGALQDGGSPDTLRLTPGRDANGEELWQRARLSATIAPDYASSIEHFAQFLTSLEIKSSVGPSLQTEGLKQADEQTPDRLYFDLNNTPYFEEVPNAYDPLDGNGPWTPWVTCMQPTGHANVNLTAYLRNVVNIDETYTDAVDFTKVNQNETATIYPLSYLQLRAGALRTTYYDLGSQYAGVNISEGETWAGRDPSGGVPRKIAQNLNQVRRRPEPLIIGSQKGRGLSSGHWGGSDSMPVMHSYHQGPPQSDYESGSASDTYTTMYDERCVAPRHVNWLKVDVMALAFMEAGLNSSDVGWEDLDAGVIADIDWRVTVSEVEGAGPSQLTQITEQVTDESVYLLSGYPRIQIINQLYRRDISVIEGQMDLSGGSDSDIPSGNPLSDYMAPDLWCDVSGRGPKLPLQVEVECKFSSMTPGVLTSDFPEINSPDANGIVSTAFSVWGFDL